GRARAAGQERTGGNVGECYPRVKRKMLRSQELNLKRGVVTMTIDSMSVLQVRGIGNRLEQVNDMRRKAREHVLMRVGDEGCLAGGEQLARLRALDRVAEGH